MTPIRECDLTVTFSGFAPLTTYPLALQYSFFPPIVGGPGEIVDRPPVTTDEDGNATVFIPSYEPDIYYLARSGEYSSPTIFCSP